MKNKKIVLTRPLEGMPREADFQVVEEETGIPGNGEILVRHRFLSLDPYQRSAIAGRHGGTGGPLGAGDMPPGETVGEIVATRDARFSEGEYVRHKGGWQTHSVTPADEVFRVDPDIAPLSTHLGVLGMPGLTAFASMVRLADVQPGQAVLISAAAGPVGATAGQIAIKCGARAYGIAGSDEKCALVENEFGFSACINYKTGEVRDKLAELLPDGADVYHDNVGGQMLEDAMSVLRPYGTVILCGLIAGYNDPSAAKGLYLGLPIVKRAVMKGLVVYDFEDQRDEFVNRVAPWIADGSMKYREDRVTGIENASTHFVRLMRGDNVGKVLVEM